MQEWSEMWLSEITQYIDTILDECLSRLKGRVDYIRGTVLTNTILVKVQKKKEFFQDIQMKQNTKSQ